MPFNVSSFASRGLPYGGARASLFEVFLFLPQGVANAAAEAQFTFVCKAAAIPASTVGQVEVPFFGRKVKFAGNRTFDNWTVTIMNDEDFAVRHAIERWSQAINSNINNLRAGSVLKETGAQSYRSIAQVRHYTKTGQFEGGAAAGDAASVSRVYTFENIFPLNISNIDLNWETTDAIEEFTVEFAYDYWTVEEAALGNVITG